MTDVILLNCYCNMKHIFSDNVVYSFGQELEVFTFFIKVNYNNSTTLYFFFLGNGCSLAALSLSGCSLGDNDILPLVAAIEQSIPLSMLKLSGNRLTDEAVKHLVDALLSHTQHSLQLLDLMNNKVNNSAQ